MRVIGIDPGKTTGLVSFNVQDNETLPIWGIEHWQLEHLGVGHWFELFRESIKNKRSEDLDTVIAMESFILTPGGKKTPAPYSLEVIGTVRYFVETSGLSLRFSAPSAHLRLISDGVLKRAGLWAAGRQHACDASRVGLFVAMIDHNLMKWALQGEEDNVT